MRPHQCLSTNVFCGNSRCSHVRSSGIEMPEPIHRGDEHRIMLVLVEGRVGHQEDVLLVSSRSILSRVPLMTVSASFFAAFIAVAPVSYFAMSSNLLRVSATSSAGSQSSSPRCNFSSMWTDAEVERQAL
eukprot:1462788-Amphidinium_carterae.2